MSNSDFTYGNILLLYCVLKEKHDAITTNNSSAKTSISQQNYINESSKNDASYLPDYIVGRINLCIETFNIIMGSKPDKFHTSIVIVSDNEHIKQIRSLLITGGISEKYLEYDDNSKSINSAFKNIMDRIVKLANPPSIYFIGSVWQKDIVASIISSKLKDYKVFFEGALDNRPYDVVQKEKLKEKPEKGSSYYKRKMTNKAIDVLLNYIFPKNKDKANVSE
ncbi:MAG TPA: hypothetical protein VFX18_01585 [Candidatus Nitrosocosmicus sp.]|nr:hypothetical protein [Candidatus Nitrosocosmicus sp.]